MVNCSTMIFWRCRKVIFDRQSRLDQLMVETPQDELLDVDLSQKIGQGQLNPFWLIMLIISFALTMVILKGVRAHHYQTGPCNHDNHVRFDGSTLGRYDRPPWRASNASPPCSCFSNPWDRWKWPDSNRAKRRVLQTSSSLRTGIL